MIELSGQEAHRRRITSGGTSKDEERMASHGLQLGHTPVKKEWDRNQRKWRFDGYRFDGEIDGVQKQRKGK